MQHSAESHGGYPFLKKRYQPSNNILKQAQLKEQALKDGFELKCVVAHKHGQNQGQYAANMQGILTINPVRVLLVHALTLKGSYVKLVQS